MTPERYRELVMRWTPVASAVLIEGGAVQQIWRMWSERAAAGQSVTGWAAVTIALCLWLNFYRVVTPEAKMAQAVAALGIVLNSAIVASILYWRSA